MPKALTIEDESGELEDETTTLASDGRSADLDLRPGPPTGRRRSGFASNPRDEDENEENEDEDDEDDDVDNDVDDDDEDLAVFTAREAAGAIATLYAFIRPLLGRYRKALMIVGFGLMVETLFNVVMPLSLKFLIDDALGRKNFHALVWILSALAAAGLVTSLTSVWYELWDARLSSSIISDVRLRLFDHIQELPIAFFARTRRGEILSRFSVDLSSFEGAMESLANTGLLPALELIAGVGLMLFLNWQLAVVALLIFPITLIGPRILTPKAVAAGYDLKVNESAILGTVQENVATQAVVKAFGLQAKARGWFTSRNQETRKKIEAATFLSIMVERTVTIAVLLLHLAVIGMGAYLAVKGKITIGTFVTFESAFWEISYNISYLMSYIPETIESAAAIRHMQDLLDEPVRGADRPGAPDLPGITHDITFDQVTFQYEGTESPVIRNLNLKLNVGKRIAIVGESGSGKSTLLNLILRLYVANQGRVTMDGVDIRKVTRESLRSQMAVVFQQDMLFNMSIRENIRLGKPGATDAEVEEAARKAEIHRYIMSLPEKYDTQVGERGETLSGGQRQRIAIARAIIRNPSLLLLDEATSALDQTTEAAINRTLLKLAKGRTMIWSTHRLTSVVGMDEIIVLSGGRVIERGSHKQLLAKNGAYRRLWDDRHRAKHAAAWADDDDDDEDED